MDTVAQNENARARRVNRGMVVLPPREEFMSIEGYTHVCVSSELSSDLETPISTFMKLRASGEEPCFMLESAENGKTWGRYSFLGFAPTAIARVKDGKLAIATSGIESQVECACSLEALFRLVEEARVFVPRAGGGTEVGVLPFDGGAVGYFGYGTFEFIEDVPLRKELGVAELPEMMFMFPRRLAVFDHLLSRMRLCVVAGLPDEAAERERIYDNALGELEEMAGRIRQPLTSGCGIDISNAPAAPRDDFTSVESNVTRESFEGMVSQALEHIFAGDVFQVVVSQRLSMSFEGDPLLIYRHLRAENPSPYMFYLQLPDVTLVGSSPEPMVTNRAGHAVIRPIAGTRPRGADADEDTAFALELGTDTKERAEHIMLVDLARNDLGRVSVPGTVKVTRLMDIEKYSHVMHMVSEVEGQLTEGSGNYELLRASFPAGTVIGAPKVRASQIIDSLEPDGRGVYAGAVGYLSYSGDMDTCITIRTVVIRDGMAYVQAGAGIVADSDPGCEYEETLNKARAVIRAVRAAGKEVT